MNFHKHVNHVEKASVSYLSNSKYFATSYQEDYIKHQWKVTKVAGALGKLLALPEIERKELIAAAYYHDIGKIKYIDLISKSGPLTTQEYEQIKLHAALGGEIVNKMGKHWLSDIILYHHENIDGTGYHGLSGNDIPEHSRIIRVADTFAALTEKRCYKPFLSQNEAISTMIAEYKKYDGDVLAELVRKYYING